MQTSQKQGPENEQPQTGQSHLQDGGFTKQRGDSGLEDSLKTQRHKSGRKDQEKTAECPKNVCYSMIYSLV